MSLTASRTRLQYKNKTNPNAIHSLQHKTIHQHNQDTAFHPHPQKPAKHPPATSAQHEPHPPRPHPRHQRSLSLSSAHPSSRHSRGSCKSAIQARRRLRICILTFTRNRSRASATPQMHWPPAAWKIFFLAWRIHSRA
jgi:hypothetical protein